MDFERTLLDILEGIGNFDFNVLIRSFLVSLVVIWFFIAVWVWIDSGERTRNMLFRIFSVLLVAPFNVVGLIIYLILRPKETIENVYWGDLERRYLLYETSELGDCPQCGDQLNPGFNICPSCSYELKIKCKGCEMMLDRKWNFCPYCKEKVLHPLPEEEEISKEVIRQRVEQSRQEIRVKVEREGTRYKTASGVTVKLGNVVMKGVMSLGKTVNDFMVRVVASLDPSKVRSQNEGGINSSDSSKAEDQKTSNRNLDEEMVDPSEEISDLTDLELETELSDLNELVEDVLQDESELDDTPTDVENVLNDMSSEDQTDSAVDKEESIEEASDEMESFDESTDVEGSVSEVIDQEVTEEVLEDVGSMKEYDEDLVEEVIQNVEQNPSQESDVDQKKKATQSQHSKRNKKRRKKKKRSK